MSRLAGSASEILLRSDIRLTQLLVDLHTAFGGEVLRAADGA